MPAQNIRPTNFDYLDGKAARTLGAVTVHCMVCRNERPYMGGPCAHAQCPGRPVLNTEPSNDAGN